MRPREHLTASLFAFSATFELGRDERHGAVARFGADLSSTVSDRADDDMDLFAAINPLLVVSTRR
jgi:hypothetical protein